MSDSHGDSAPDAKGKPPKQSLFTRIAESITLVVVFASVVGLFGAKAWGLDLINHFRPFMLVVLVLLCLVPSLLRRPGWLVQLVIGIAVNAVIVLPIFFGRDARDVDPEVPPLTLVAFNVHTTNPRHADVVSYLAASHADLILLQEVSEGWMADIKSGLPTYDVLFEQPRDDNFGIALLALRTSRGESEGLRINSISVIDLAGGRAGVPTVELTGYWYGRPLALLGVHTLPPVSTAMATVRDEQLKEVGTWARDHERVASIVAGDLNATPWCMPFLKLMAQTGLYNTMKGAWPTGTWHTSLPAVAQLPIDHCLCSAVLVAVSREVGPDSMGSDHRPIKVTLAWAAGMEE